MLYKHRFRYWFTDAEVHELKNCNKGFEELISEKKAFCNYFRTANKGKKGSFMSVVEIRERIGAILKYNLSNSKINREIDKLGYVSAMNAFFRDFIVILLSPSEITDNKNDKSTKEK